MSGGALTDAHGRIRMTVRGDIMPTMKDKDLLKLLKKNGWQEISIRGSHHHLRKGRHTETIAVHGKDMPIGELNAILKRCGLTPVH